MGHTIGADRVVTLDSQKEGLSSTWRESVVFVYFGFGSSESGCDEESSDGEGKEPHFL